MINTPKRKILVIPSWYPPDGGYFFRNHSIGLLKMGLEVDVITASAVGVKSLTFKKLGEIGKIKATEISGLNEYLTRYVRIPLVEKPNMKLWQAKMLRLFDWYLQNQGRPDAILAHSSIWAGVVAEKINKKHGIPYIITEHRSRFVNNTPEARQLFKPWYFPLLHKAFDNASAVVTVSDSLQPFIKEIVPSVAPRIRTIFNTVDTEFFAPQKKRRNNQKYTIFSLGNLEPVKGFDNLINAFSILPEETKATTKLVIGGQGSRRKNLEELVKQNGLEKSVSFTGSLTQSEVLENYQNADAFVLASHFEAFGVVYIEAMSCGLPVIATKAGGPQGFVTPELGILVEPGNSQSLAAAMEKIIENSANFDSEAIRQHTINTFGHEIVARKYVALFDEILNAPSR